MLPPRLHNSGFRVGVKRNGGMRKDGPRQAPKNVWKEKGADLIQDKGVGKNREFNINDTSLLEDVPGRDEFKGLEPVQDT